jgi:beta-mannosidase
MVADEHPAITWVVRPSDTGAWASPSSLPLGVDGWLPAEVPGTAASSLRTAGQWTWDDHRDFDAHDWWWRGTFATVEADHGWLLDIGGLATVAEVWLDGGHVLSSTNMWLAHQVELAPLTPGDHEIVVCCRALKPLLAGPRKPRARWRTRLVTEPNLRWYRTTFLGRMPGWSPRPAPVGPWRPISIGPLPKVRVRSAGIVPTCVGVGGTVDIDLLVSGAVGRAIATVADESITLEVTALGDDWRLRGRLNLDVAERWWPHTHGKPTRHRLTVTVDDRPLLSRSIGFRDLRIDDADGGFGLVINDVPVFARGACWTPTDPVRAASPDTTMRETLDLVVETGMNIVRVMGTMLYEAEEFHDACDELGVLVWQDLMFANFDYPATPEFIDTVREEVHQFAMRVQGRPSLVVVSGGSEIEQQAAMTGLTADRWANALFDTQLPDWIASLLPGVRYVRSSPTGGALPFHPDTGVAHYYGVGAYLRDLNDARLSNVRFAAECLAFANVPDEETVDAFLTAGQTPPTHPRWKERVPRDNGVGWDFDDVRDHYLGLLHGVDPIALRSADPGEYLRRSRDVTGEVMARTFAEWRRPGSSCNGAIVLMLRDLWPGAGWGLIDAEGRPKQALRSLRPILRESTAFLTDEGMNGLWLHIVDDRVVVDSSAAGSPLVPLRCTPTGTTLSLRQHGSVSVDELMGRFSDSTYSYRFGPPASDPIVLTIDHDAHVVHVDWGAR